MSAPDPARLAALARRLGLSPRGLALAAARLAREPAPVDAARRRALIDAARGAANSDAALLLATPIADFAQDEVDRALAGLWPARLHPDA
ncbi:MAG: hypothetical protein GXC76_13090 [Rhodanobacteraceae bacterium]|jgi:hypothetical protein|nr:hypothetical protein [Rhodanobacteraceae bacterium]